MAIEPSSLDGSKLPIVGPGPYHQVTTTTNYLVDTLNPTGYSQVMIANITEFGAGELQRKWKQRNQVLEQTVEKGAIALQQQEEELKRAREIQQMLLPSTLLPAGVQTAGAWQAPHLIEQEPHCNRRVTDWDFP